MKIGSEFTRRAALMSAAAAAGAGIVVNAKPAAASVAMSNSPMSNSPSIYDYGGLGNGSDDYAAIAACLAAEGSCYLPFFQPNTTTEATYYFSQAVVLTEGMSVIGESRQRKSRVEQAAGENLFVISGNNTGVSDLLIDASATTATGSGQATFLIDTTAQTTAPNRLQNVRIDGIQWGMDRDFVTLMNGWDFMTDNGGPGIVIDMRVEDVEVWGAKGRPFDFTRLFAFVWFDHVTVDWTRQSQTPAVAGIRVDGGQGICCQDFAIQGWGSTGTGNNLQNGFDFSNGAAIQFIRTRADSLGGVGYKLVNLDSVEMVAPVSSLCADHQYFFNNCLRIVAGEPYAEGRLGLPGSVAIKHGIVVEGCANQVITGARAISCTGSGLVVKNSQGILFTGFQAAGNLLYGWEEMGTSNYNGLSGGVFAGNAGGGSGRTGPSGANSFVDGSMRQSGVVANGYVPGASTTW